MEQLIDAELLAPSLAELSFRVNFALHDIVFAVDRRQTALGLHEYQAIHAVRDVMRDHRCGAVPWLPEL